MTKKAFIRRGQNLDPQRMAALKAFTERVHLRFRNYRLLDQALTHSSYSNEVSGLESNQRLEYLGDSVLGLVVNDHIYRTYPELAEGKMARIKSAVVSEESLATAARAIRLGSLILFSKGEKNSGGGRRPSTLSDAMEALIAAVYLDQGLPRARKFILELLEKRIETYSRSERAVDPKSRLQEMIQKMTHQHPVYEVVSEDGPVHKKEFICRVMIEGEEIARGSGSSRKKAEQKAASKALSVLHGKV